MSHSKISPESAGNSPEIQVPRHQHPILQARPFQEEKSDLQLILHRVYLPAQGHNILWSLSSNHNTASKPCLLNQRQTATNRYSREVGYVTDKDVGT